MRYRKIVPRAVSVVAALGFGCILWFGRIPFTLGGHSGPQLVDPGVTLADVQRVADGGRLTADRSDGNPLVNRLIGASADPLPIYFLPGAETLEIGFGPPAGLRGESTRFGWPTEWYTQSRSSSFENAVNKEGFKPAITDRTMTPITDFSRSADPNRVPPAWRWRADGAGLWYRPPPEETAGVVTMTRVKWSGPLAVVAILILSWLLIGAIVRVVGCIRRRPIARRLARRVRLIAAGLVLLVLLVGLVASRSERAAPPRATWAKFAQVGVAGGPVFFTYAGFERLNLNRDELRELTKAPNGDREVAREILRVASAAPSGIDATGAYLAVRVNGDRILNNHWGVLLNRALPLLWFRRDEYSTRTISGAAVTIATPAGLTATVQDGWAIVGWSAGSVAQPAYRAQINIEAAAMVFVGSWVLVLVSGRIGVAIDRRRIAGRRSKNQCARCGYQLEGNDIIGASS